MPYHSTGNIFSKKFYTFELQSRIPAAMSGLSTLRPDQGIPAPTLLMMSAVAGLTVANLYYNQPLLEDIRTDLACSGTLANLITVVTQGSPRPVTPSGSCSSSPWPTCGPGAG